VRKSLASASDGQIKQAPIPGSGATSLGPQKGQKEEPGTEAKPLEQVVHVWELRSFVYRPASHKEQSVLLAAMAYLPTSQAKHWVFPD